MSNSVNNGWNRILMYLTRKVFFDKSPIRTAARREIARHDVICPILSVIRPCPVSVVCAWGCFHYSIMDYLGSSLSDIMLQYKQPCVMFFVSLVGWSAINCVQPSVAFVYGSSLLNTCTSRVHSDIKLRALYLDLPTAKMPKRLHLINSGSTRYYCHSWSLPDSKSSRLQ